MDAVNGDSCMHLFLCTVQFPFDKSILECFENDIYDQECKALSKA
jgi:hypothetical protein